MKSTSLIVKNPSPPKLLENMGRYKQLSKKTDRVVLRARGVYYDFGKGAPVKSNVVSRLMNADILNPSPNQNVSQ